LNIAAIALSAAITFMSTATFLPIHAELKQKYQHEKLDVATYAYLDNKAYEYGVSTELVLAVMQVESNYTPNLTHKNTNGTTDYGLMQINSSNHKWLQDKLGQLDFLNEQDSILAGIYMLSMIKQESSNTHEILMVYNMGRSTYSRLASRGITSSTYSRKVMKILDANKKANLK